MSTPSQRRSYRLTVDGPISHSVADAVRIRFLGIAVHAERDADGCVLEVPGTDQPALRALLTLLWDAGHELRACSSTPVAVVSP